MMWQSRRKSIAVTSCGANGGGDSPSAAGDPLRTGQSRSLTCSQSPSTTTLHDNDGLSYSNSERGRSPARQGRECRRSQSADNVCVAVDVPPAELGSPPSPGGVSNDLKNVLHLAEPDGDATWNSAASCTEDDDDSISVASEFSSDFGSDSDSREYVVDNSSYQSPLTVLITDKLRQLASSTRPVRRISRDADSLQTSPPVEQVDTSAGSFAENENGRVPGNESEEEEEVSSAADVKFYCENGTKTANGGDVAVVFNERCDGEIRVPEFELVWNGSENFEDEEEEAPPSCSIIESLYMPTLVEESAGEVDGAVAQSSNSAETTSSAAPGEISDAGAEMPPPGFVKRQALECERLLSDTTDAPASFTPATSGERLARADSDANRSLPSSGRQGNAVENSSTEMAGTTQGVVVGPVAVRVEDEVFLSSAVYDGGGCGAKPVAVVVEAGEDSDPEATWKPRVCSVDSVVDGDLLWPGQKRNYVCRLARAYSNRVKELNESASPYRCGRLFLTSRRKMLPVEETWNGESALALTTSGSLPARMYKSAATATPPTAVAAASGGGCASRRETIARWNAARDRARSAEQLTTFPRANVRETILKLKQKATAGNVYASRRPTPPVSPAYKSSPWPSSSSEEDTRQSAGADSASSHNPLTTRQANSLIEERVRMLYEHIS